MKRLGLLVFCATLATGAGAVSMVGIHAGGDTEIDEPVAGSLYVAGGRVTVSAPVSGKTRIAAGRVEIASRGALAKGATIAGGRVVVKGSVEGDLRVAGGHVTLDGPVSGDASVAAGTLELGPNARIEGRLTFRGDQLDRDPGAQVKGGVVRKDRHSRSWDGGGLGRGVAWAIWTLGLMVLAAIIAGALPGATRRMENELRARPWLASIFGIVALICIPIAAVLVMITIIGIPVGLLALLGYVALLVVGYVTASVVLGGLVLDKLKAGATAQTAWRVGAAVVAMLVIASLAKIPFVGGLVGLSALVIGVGVIVAATVHRKSPPPATAAA
ncbi:MAG: hypothetical protein H7Y14_13940 [Burkholderiales bacterium]|nr:hypothetical protein [Burkholderiales bacterium]